MTWNAFDSRSVRFAAVFMAAVALSLAGGTVLAKKPGGGGGGKPPSEPPPPPAGDECAGTPGVFPAMAYNKWVLDKRGRRTGTQIFLADNLGECEVLVYETSLMSGSVSFYFDGGSGALAWAQVRDDGESRRTGLPVIKVASVEVAGNVVTLPLSPITVHQSSTNETFSFDDVELSKNGSRVAFSTTHGSPNQGFEERAVLVCDVANCSPEVAFSDSSSDPTVFVGGTFDLAWGRNEIDGDARIYFLYRKAVDAGIFSGNLVMIEEDGSWTDPVLVATNEDWGDDGGTALHEPSVYSDDSNPNVDVPDVLALTSRDGSGSVYRVDTINIGSCAEPVSISCVADGDSTLTFIAVGWKPSWTLFPTIGDPTSPNLIANEFEGANPSHVVEIDPESGTRLELPPVGVDVDSAY